MDCTVQRGLYRGRVNKIGYDGIWTFGGKYSVIVEVKTTDAYTVNLDSIAQYRKSLIKDGLSSEQSSILIVVGRKDTGSLEAQVRGSRHAWDVRLISADALLRLVKIKETADNKTTIAKVSSILKPLELTKLDFVIDLLATTTEDIQEITDTQETESICQRKPKRILVRVALSYIAFGCGSPSTILVFKLKEFSGFLKDMNITQLKDRIYWHVHIMNDPNGVMKLLFKAGIPGKDVTNKLLEGK